MDFKTALFCEFDESAATSYAAIHNIDSSLNIGDITKVNEKEVPDFNTMFGGSPCQDFSVAGKQQGAIWTCKSCGHRYNPLEVHYTQRDRCPKCGGGNLEKTRSSLLVEWLRFLREKKPRFAIYENVKNIVSSRFRPMFDLFVKELEDYGYNVYWKILNAKNYGIPQNRERIYCVIIKREFDNGEFKFPNPIPLAKELPDFLDDHVEEKYYLSEEKIEQLISEGFAPPDSSRESVTQSEREEEAQRIVTHGTWFPCKVGAKLSNKGSKFEGYTDVSLALLARDYKGFGNQQMTGVIEYEKGGNRNG